MPHDVKLTARVPENEPLLIREVAYASTNLTRWRQSVEALILAAKTSARASIEKNATTRLERVGSEEIKLPDKEAFDCRPVATSRSRPNSMGDQYMKLNPHIGGANAMSSFLLLFLWSPRNQSIKSNERLHDYLTSSMTLVISRDPEPANKQMPPCFFAPWARRSSWGEKKVAEKCAHANREAMMENLQ